MTDVYRAAPCLLTNVNRRMVVHEGTCCGTRFLWVFCAVIWTFYGVSTRIYGFHGGILAYLQVFSSAFGRFFGRKWTEMAGFDDAPPDL